MCPKPSGLIWNRWYYNTNAQFFEARDKCLDTAEQPYGHLIDHTTEAGKHSIEYVP
jgi:hypothetical protein